MSITRLPPSLFELKAGNFYIALVGELDRRQVLKIIRKYLKPDQRIFVGVIAPIDPHIETPEEVRDRSFEPDQNWRWCYVSRLILD
jgi:5-methyltetrahydropteroyltriglutamate--homocysteine methyltransferase